MEPGSLPPEAAAPIAAREPFPIKNLVLFLATIASTIAAGGLFAAGNGYLTGNLSVGAIVQAGIPFSASVLGILVAHEMGHFLTARYHRVDASWPYFIPLPLGIGTLGAIIRMRGRIPTRDALVDIGASGPLAGFLVAVPVLVYGISISQVVAAPATPNVFFGNLSIVSMVQHWLAGLPVGILEGNMEPQPLLYVALKKLVFGIGAHQDVAIHPIAFAGVIGLYVTALNLLPFGQLDGGHVAYAMLGRRAETVGKVASVLLVALALVSSWFWLVWLLLVRWFVGLKHPPVDAEGPLSPGRKWIVAATVLLFLLTLTPVSMDKL